MAVIHIDLDEPADLDHQEWVRHRVREALEDARPPIPHDEVKIDSERKIAEALSSATTA